MKTFIINLDTSLDRRKYMEEMIEKLRFNYEFITAVDGKNIKKTDEVFDTKPCEKRYVRKILPGEIGCTLSHQKCYKRIIEDDLKYALILEDDMWFVDDINSIVNPLESFLQDERPIVVLLSGRYWYRKTIKRVDANHDIKRLYDAFLTQAYFINNAGARALFCEKPDFKADDWFYFEKKGLNLFGVFPHISEENASEGFKSTIYENNKLYPGFYWEKTRLYFHEMMREFYRIIGHYESEGGYYR